MRRKVDIAIMGECPQEGWQGMESCSSRQLGDDRNQDCHLNIHPQNDPLTVLEDGVTPPVGSQ
jgi:hypothetical protein